MTIFGYYELNKMKQLTFKFPFKTNYFEEDFYVSSNNFEAYKLLESWPKWSSKFINIFGPSGCGKSCTTREILKEYSFVVIYLLNLQLQ